MIKPVLSNRKNILIIQPYTQLTFKCSKSTIKTLEKGLKYVQS